jgi:hypothetical protein
VKCECARAQAYEVLRPRFPGVAGVLREIPDVDAHDLRRLDEKLAATTAKPSKIDKSKRDLFKKITSRVFFTFNLSYCQPINAPHY